MKRAMTGAALVALALGGCSGGGARELAVTSGWVRLPANPAAPAAAYFTVTGGREPATLTGVSTDMALKAEMHETMTMKGPGGMTGMAPLAGVRVPAGGAVAFRPGGRHVMLFDVNRGVRPGGTFVMTFAFAGRYPLSERLKVVGPADPAPDPE